MTVRRPELLLYAPPPPPLLSQSPRFLCHWCLEHTGPSMVTFNFRSQGVKEFEAILPPSSQIESLRVIWYKFGGGKYTHSQQLSSLTFRSVLPWGWTFSHSIHQFGTPERANVSALMLLWEFSKHLVLNGGSPCWLWVSSENKKKVMGTAVTTWVRRGYALRQ